MELSYSRLKTTEVATLTRAEAEVRFREEAENFAQLQLALEYCLYNQSQLQFRLNKLRRENGEIR